MAKTKFIEALESGRLAVTAECNPPRSGNSGAIRKLSSVLPPGLDAVIVAANPDRICGSPLACAAMLASEGVSAVLSLVTRDSNRIGLESDALGAMAFGASGILSLSGDHQTLGASPQAAGAYDIDSIQLVQMLDRLRRESPDHACVIGAAAHPYLKPVELNMLRLRKKIAAGADFIVTQAVTDLDGFLAWMDVVRDAGLDKRVAIIAGVPVSGGGAIAARLKSLPGLRGIHIFSGGNEQMVTAVIQEAGLA